MILRSENEDAFIETKVEEILVSAERMATGKAPGPVINRRLQAELEDKNGLSDRQYGFRQGSIDVKCNRGCYDESQKRNELLLEA